MNNFMPSLPIIKRTKGMASVYINVHLSHLGGYVGIKEHVGHKIKLALSWFNDRVEITDLTYQIISEADISCDIKSVVLSFPVKIYTRHELKQKKYRESIEYVYNISND